MIETKCDGCGQVIDRKESGTWGNLFRNTVQIVDKRYDFCNLCMTKVQTAMTDALPLLREKLINDFVKGIQEKK